MNAHGTPNQSGDGKTGPGQEPAPSSDEQTIPPASQESSSLRSQGTDAGNSPWGAPKGYDQVQSQNSGMNIKNQLDAIPTPGLSQPQAAQPRPQAPPPQPQVAAQTTGAEEDWKSQLDAIPTPGGSQAQAAPVAPAAPPRPAAPPPPPQPQAPPAPAMGDLKSQLDAIPTPGGQQSAPPPQPQAAPPPQPQAAPPQPQAAPPPQPVIAGEEDWKSQLDAIPTPKGLDGGGGSPTAGAGPGLGNGTGLGAGAGAGPGAVRPTPMSTPQPGAMASDMFAGGQGASNQSGIDYARSKEFSSVDTSSGYTMIAVVLVLVVLCVFGFMMMNPGKQPDFSSVPTSAPTTTTAPAPAPAPTTNTP